MDFLGVDDLELGRLKAFCVGVSRKDNCDRDEDADPGVCMMTVDRTGRIVDNRSCDAHE